MSRLAHLCARWRYAVAGIWIAVLLALVGGVAAAGSGFTDVADLPDGEAAHAMTLLAQANPSSHGDTTSSPEGTESGTIVWHSNNAAVESPQVRAEVSACLADLATQPGVVSVVSPYAEAGAGQLNAHASTAYATVQVTVDADTAALRQQVEEAVHAGSSHLDVALGGRAFTEQPAAGGGTEGLGILAALVILVVMFRSVWAAILPILTGIVGVGVSLLLVMLGSHVVDLSSTSITMAALIGLGVGIDYALFIVNRYRTGLMSGMSVHDAVTKAVDTSGRAVIFAGLTVAVALAAIVVVGLGILTGMAQAAAVTVLVTVAAAVTLLPALLTMLGHRVLSRRQRKILAGLDSPAPASAASQGRTEHSSLAGRWAGMVLRRPVGAALVAALVIGALAFPMVGMRIGSPDSSSDPKGSANRTYADLMAPAFGAGIDAPLLLVAEVPDTTSIEAFESLIDEVKSTPGVASVTATQMKPGATVASAVVIPRTSAGDVKTQDLVHTLRDGAIPAAEHNNSMQVLVGGQTATNIDVADALMSKLPLYLGMVALLGFLLLVLAFRSVWVPLIGAVSNLATIMVALGVVTAVFQFGWGSGPLGVGAGAPIMYLTPILIIGIMFGLSMDYQVFLVSRMHEEYTQTSSDLSSITVGGHQSPVVVHTAAHMSAIRIGLTETAKVIATAALIMLSVFASFGLSGERIVASIGIGLAAGVLVDAFIIRMLLMPALMRLIGPRIWAYPRWADRITPHLSIEGPTPPHLPRSDHAGEPRINDQSDEPAEVVSRR